VEARPFVQEDAPMLEYACQNNRFDPDCQPSWYVAPGRYAEVYEHEGSPVGVISYSKSLRLRSIWCDVDDRETNAKSIIQAIEDAVQKARAAGFTEIIFQTDNPALAKFCTSKLGFEESRGEFIKYVSKE